MPDDLEFLEVVESLDIPQKIGEYMRVNFDYEFHSFYKPDPYFLWKTQKGDCNDFSTFAVFVANYHGYETYQIRIEFNKTVVGHYLAVYVDGDEYTYSSNMFYYSVYFLEFEDIVENYMSKFPEKNVRYYKVYDYEMNLIEEGKNGR